jgi:hypothetical protein
MSARTLQAALPPAPWTALALVIVVVAVSDPTLRAPVLTLTCVAVSFYRLDLGVLLWMACTALAPAPLVRVRNSMICLSTAVLSALLVRWLLERLQRGELRLPRSRLTVPLLAIALTALASGLMGALFYDPAVPGVHRFALAQLYATALIVLSVATPFLVSEHIASRRRLTTVAIVLVAVGMLMTVTTMTQPRLMMVPRWYPIIITYAFTFACAAIVCRLPRRPWHWVAAVSAIALTLEGPAKNFIFHHSQWVSGWIMIGVPLLLLPLVSFPRFTLAALVIGGTASAYWVWPLVENAFELARREGDFGRLRIWQDALLMGGLRPFLGVGLGNYIDYAERYAQVDIALASAHGNYQQIVAEMGLTGFGFVLWALSRAFGLAWHLFRAASDPLYRTIGLAVFGGLAGQAAAAVVGDYLLPSYHNGGHGNISATIYTWIWIGALMATDRLAFAGRKP